MRAAVGHVHHGERTEQLTRVRVLLVAVFRAARVPLGVEQSQALAFFASSRHAFRLAVMIDSGPERAADPVPLMKNQFMPVIAKFWLPWACYSMSFGRKTTGRFLCIRGSHHSLSIAFPRLQR